jgi:transposase-like protein
MKAKFITIEEIRSTLDRLRQDPRTQRKFPQELWASIIQQTNIYSIEEVCHRLQINPVYLKRKIHQFKEPKLEFREIVMPIQSVSDPVTIELKSPDGLQAKIQGPFSCLNFLCQLFRR